MYHQSQMRLSKSTRLQRHQSVHSCLENNSSTSPHYGAKKKLGAHSLASPGKSLQRKGTVTKSTRLSTQGKQEICGQSKITCLFWLFPLPSIWMTMTTFVIPKQRHIVHKCNTARAFNHQNTKVSRPRTHQCTSTSSAIFPPY